MNITYLHSYMIKLLIEYYFVALVSYKIKEKHYSMKIVLLNNGKEKYGKTKIHVHEILKNMKIIKLQ